MADWVGKSTALLEPLAEAIAKRVKDGAALFADDTLLKMQAPIARQAHGTFTERGKQKDQDSPHLGLCQRRAMVRQVATMRLVSVRR